MSDNNKTFVDGKFDETESKIDDGTFENNRKDGSIMPKFILIYGGIK
jgi:hypothetical protein